MTSLTIHFMASARCTTHARIITAPLTICAVARRLVLLRLVCGVAAPGVDRVSDPNLGVTGKIGSSGAAIGRPRLRHRNPVRPPCQWDWPPRSDAGGSASRTSSSSALSSSGRSLFVSDKQVRWARRPIEAFEEPGPSWRPTRTSPRSGRRTSGSRQARRHLWWPNCGRR